MTVLKRAVWMLLGAFVCSVWCAAAFGQDFVKANDAISKCRAHASKGEACKAAQACARARSALSGADKLTTKKVMGLCGCADAQKQCAALTPPPVKIKEEIKDVMAYVPAGDFLRGSKDGGSDEQPVKKVYVSDFWIDVYEVTVEEYAVCMKAGKCRAPRGGGSCNWGVEGRGKHPVNCVDWTQAVAYCAWRGKRLPREVEWEKAARGVDGRKYPWGNAAASCQYAVMAEGGDGCGKGSTWEVGSKPLGVSPYGVHDMGGNVWEWVGDWYDSSYYGSEASLERDPEGPESGSDRVLRGGSWDYVGSYLRAAYRYRSAPSDAYANLGFRCVKVR